MNANQNFQNEAAREAYHWGYRDGSCSFVNNGHAYKTVGEREAYDKGFLDGLTELCGDQD